MISIIDRLLRGIYTDEDAVSTLAPGRGSGDGHVENEDKVSEVGVWIWI